MPWAALKQWFYRIFYPVLLLSSRLRRDVAGLLVVWRYRARSFVWSLSSSDSYRTSLHCSLLDQCILTSNHSEHYPTINKTYGVIAPKIWRLPASTDFDDIGSFTFHYIINMAFRIAFNSFDANLQMLNESCGRCIERHSRTHIWELCFYGTVQTTYGSPRLSKTKEQSRERLLTSTFLMEISLNGGGGSKLF